MEVVAATGPVDDLDLPGLRKGRREGALRAARSSSPKIPAQIAATMRARCAVCSSGSCSRRPLPRSQGRRPRRPAWAPARRRGRARSPPSARGLPAGGTSARPGAIVRERLLALGYDVETQRFPLPGGGRSLNVVGRTPGPIRGDHRRAHGRSARHERRQRQRLRRRAHARARAVRSGTSEASSSPPSAPRSGAKPEPATTSGLESSHGRSRRARRKESASRSPSTWWESERR